jgi:hypothetical protein
MLKRYLSGLALAAMAAGAISTSNAAEAGLAPQTSDERGVKVTVTPQALAQATWNFEVTLETHTQNLSDDLSRSASLVAEGKQYSPLGWEGAAPGGHHRGGLLRFKAIVPQPGLIELRIRLAGETSPRSFKWTLK